MFTTSQRSDVVVSDGWMAGRGDEDHMRIADG
jgi:hypothetical protein